MNYLYDAAFVIFNAYDQLLNNCSELSTAIGGDLCSPDAEITSSTINRIINASAFEGITGHIAFQGNDPVSKGLKGRQVVTHPPL